MSPGPSFVLRWFRAQVSAGVLAGRMARLRECPDVAALYREISDICRELEDLETCALFLLVDAPDAYNAGCVRLYEGIQVQLSAGQHELNTVLVGLVREPRDECAGAGAEATTIVPHNERIPYV